MSDDREPIIDALLEEVLGDQQPPDLTQRILGAYDAATDSSIDVGRLQPAAQSNGHSKKLSPTVSAKTRDLDDVAPQITADEPRKTAKKANWQTWASVAVVLVGLGGFLYWAATTGQDHNSVINGPKIVEHQPRIENDNQLANSPNVVEDETANQEEYIPPGTEIDEEPSVVPNDTQIVIKDPETPRDLENQPTEPSNPSDVELVEVDHFASPIYERELEIGESESTAHIISAIDERVSKKWELTSIEPTDEVNDRQWIYRASNFLLGRRPNQKELVSFSRSLDREAEIDRMLASTEFGRRWAVFYTHVLTGATTHSNPVDKRELAKYLANSINEGKAYDQLAFELITAAGANKPSDPDFNPATNFLLANQQIEWVNGKRRDQHKLQATERVSQIFLGRQLQCARCHDHGGTTQDQYYQMVSFFTQLHPINAQETGGVSKLKNADYAGGATRNIDEADVYFTRHSIGTGVSVYPRFLDGREAPTKSGRLRDTNRRETLAKFVVSSEDFPRAFVNRIWDEALGYGLTTPIEDMGGHNPPTHPELLESLSEQFKNSGYDIKPIMKWIALSRPFKLQSRANSSMLVRRPDMFSSFARTDRDLLYLSLKQAMNESSRALREGVAPDAHAQIGMEEDQKMSPAQRSRLQASLNAKKDFLKARYGTLLAELARNEKLTDLDRVNHVFLVTVGRLADQYERDRGIEILEAKKNDPESALQDIVVLILNSKEFATQH